MLNNPRKKLLSQQIISLSACFVLAAVMLFGLPIQAGAQTAGGGSASVSEPVLPSDISAAKLDAEIETLQSDGAIDEAVRKSAVELYKSAKERLALGEESKAQVAALKAQNDTSDVQLRRLNQQLETALAQLQTPPAPRTGPMTDDALFEMEQELRGLEGEAETLRDEIKNLDSKAATLSGRIQAARAERLDVTKRLDDVTAQIAGFSGPPDSAAEQARRINLQVRRYAREWEIRALDAEVSNIPVQERLLIPARDLASAKLQNVTRRIQVLRDRTGEQRLAEATARLTESRADAARLSQAHPIVVAYAEDNLDYAQQLLQIAKAGGNSSVVEARVNGQIKRLSEDNLLAKQILGEGNLDRQFGTVLRRLRSNIPDKSAIVRDVNTRSKTKLDISMQRILAQDELKEFSLSGPDIDAVYARWAGNNAAVAAATPPLSETDVNALEGLIAKQRTVLSEIVSNANRKVEKLVLLNTLQQSLIAEIDNLTGLLDQQLIWLPSTEVISLRWPMRVIEGVGTLLRPSNFSGVWTAFKGGLSGNLIRTALALIVTVTALYFRSGLTGRVNSMRNTVGRVKEDDHWTTPIAVLSGLVRVLPVTVPLLWIGYIIHSGAGTAFAARMGSGLMISALIWQILMTVRFWSRDGGLFDLHFKVKEALRTRVGGNMIWLAATQTAAVIVMSLCEDYASESPTAGLGLFAFMVGALSLAVLAYRILHHTRKNGTDYLRSDTFVSRHTASVFWISVAIPVVITLLAMGGYFATAVEIHSRLLVTAVLLLAAYVTYGVVKRTVEVSERRLALQAAQERRAAALKEREKREEAEERGEVPVPNLDYEGINLESMSRQSTQLLNIIGVILFSGLAWILWSDLLPALSIFDRVELPFDTSMTNADGDRVAVPATLWDLIQAIFVGTLAFLAAKNLPGFLDLFVLKRSRLTAGTRYAVTTVIGYIIVIIGIMLVGDRLGIEWGSLQWIIAALGVGIGFGLQEIIANFISGLIILFERPVRIGDYVTIGDQSGTVNRIQIRATTLADLDNREILIPNKELITGRVTNWTLSNSTLRMIVKVGVAYGTDTDLAQRTIMRAVRKVKSVLDTPEPQVLFLGFGDSSLDFEIRIYLPSFTARFPVAHDIHTEVNKALNKAGISIPFPQRDLHIITPEGGLAPEPVAAEKPKAKSKPAAKAKAKPAAKPKSSAKPST